MHQVMAFLCAKTKGNLWLILQVIWSRCQASRLQKALLPSHTCPPSLFCIYSSLLSQVHRNKLMRSLPIAYICVFMPWSFLIFFSSPTPPQLTSSHLCWYLWNTPLMIIFAYVDRYIVLKYIGGYKTLCAVLYWILISFLSWFGFSLLT